MQRVSVTNGTSSLPQVLSDRWQARINSVQGIIKLLNGVSMDSRMSRSLDLTALHQELKKKESDMEEKGREITDVKELEKQIQIWDSSVESLKNSIWTNISKMKESFEGPQEEKVAFEQDQKRLMAERKKQKDELQKEQKRLVDVKTALEQEQKRLMDGRKEKKDAFEKGQRKLMNEKKEERDALEKTQKKLKNEKAALEQKQKKLKDEKEQKKVVLVAEKEQKKVALEQEQKNLNDRKAALQEVQAKLNVQKEAFEKEQTKLLTEKEQKKVALEKEQKRLKDEKEQKKVVLEQEKKKLSDQKIALEKEHREKTQAKVALEKSKTKCVNGKAALRKDQQNLSTEKQNMLSEYIPFIESMNEAIECIKKEKFPKIQSSGVLDAIYGWNDPLYAQRKEIESSLQALIQQLKAQKVKNVEEPLKQIGSDIKKLEGQIESKREAISGLAREKKREETIVDKSISKIEGSISEEDSSIKAKQKEIAELDKQIRAIPGEIAALDKPIEAKQKEVDELDKQIRLIPGEIAALDKPIEAKQKEIDELDKQIRAIPGKIVALDKPIEAIQREIADLDKPIEAKQKEVADLDGPIEAKQKEIADLDKSMQVIPGEIAVLDKPIEAKQKEVADLGKSIQAIQKKIDDLDQQSVFKIQRNLSSHPVTSATTESKEQKGEKKPTPAQVEIQKEIETLEGKIERIFNGLAKGDQSLVQSQKQVKMPTQKRISKDSNVTIGSTWQSLPWWGKCLSVITCGIALCIAYWWKAREESIKCSKIAPCPSSSSSSKGIQANSPKGIASYGKTTLLPPCKAEESTKEMLVGLGMSGITGGSKGFSSGSSSNSVNCGNSSCPPPSCQTVSVRPAFPTEGDSKNDQKPSQPSVSSISDSSHSSCQTGSVMVAFATQGESGACDPSEPFRDIQEDDLAERSDASSRVKVQAFG